MYSENENQKPFENTEMFGNQWQPNTGAFYTEQNDSIRKQKKVKKAKKPITGGKLFAACTASALIAVIASSAVMYGGFKTVIEEDYALKTEVAASNIGTTLANVTLTNASGDSSSDSRDTYSATQVAEAVMPSVVSITSTAIIEANYNPFYGGTTQYQVTGAGSGIIVGKNDTELLIVTNNHVVEDTTSLTVEFCNGISIDSAYVKGTDSSNDIAVVGINIQQLDAETLSAIKIAVLGDSDDLNVGDSVIAIGNALGYGQSVTAGVVSALGREITLDSGTIKVIQTDASINGGNSGGALVNMYGEVIGINVAKASQSASSSASVEGMGYAIPITEVTDIINELMNKEAKVPVSDSEQGYLGITSSGYVEVDYGTSSIYNIPVGIYIRTIIEGSPLDVAGIEEGDVITGVEGETIETYQDLVDEMQYYAIGDTITLTVQIRSGREYEENNIDVTLVSLEELEKLLEDN